MGDVASDARALGRVGPKVGAHLAHCCRTHGCKYHSTWCPVRDGHMVPTYALGCQACAEQYEEATMTEKNKPRTDAAGRVWTYVPDDPNGYWQVTSGASSNPRLVRASNGWVLRQAGKDDIPLEREEWIEGAIAAAQKHLPPVGLISDKTDASGRVWAFDDKVEAGSWVTPMNGGSSVARLVKRPRGWALSWVGAASGLEHTDKDMIEEAIEYVRPFLDKVDLPVKNLLPNLGYGGPTAPVTSSEGAWLVCSEHGGIWVYLTEIDALRAVNAQAVAGESESGLRAYFVPDGAALSSVRGF